jgi:hypothetical protein
MCFFKDTAKAKVAVPIGIVHCFVAVSPNQCFVSLTRHRLDVESKLTNNDSVRQPMQTHPAVMGDYAERLQRTTLRDVDADAGVCVTNNRSRELLTRTRSDRTCLGLLPPPPHARCAIALVVCASHDNLVFRLVR